jgi:hypothetical protein
MSCSAPTCGDACCIPAGSNIANPLGFSGRHPCCAAPCVQFPPNNVQICLTINSQTQVKISQGCRLDSEDCDLFFPPSVATDSWGKRCRLVSWSRQVPTGAYIRIQLCPLDSCTDACSPPTYSSLIIPNSLSTFTVNGVNKAVDLAAAAVAGGTIGCYIKAACIGVRQSGPSGDSFDPANACCQWITPVDGSANRSVSWLNVITPSASFADLPVGTELIFGPIGL